MFCVAYVIVKTEVQMDNCGHPQDVPNKCVVDYIKSVALISDTIKYETQYHICIFLLTFYLHVTFSVTLSLLSNCAMTLYWRNKTFNFYHSELEMQIPTFYDADRRICSDR